MPLTRKKIELTFVDYVRSFLENLLHVLYREEENSFLYYVWYKRKMTVNYAVFSAQSSSEALTYNFFLQNSLLYVQIDTYSWFSAYVCRILECNPVRPGNLHLYIQFPDTPSELRTTHLLGTVSREFFSDYS